MLKSDDKQRALDRLTRAIERFSPSKAKHKTDKKKKPLKLQKAS